MKTLVRIIALILLPLASHAQTRALTLNPSGVLIWPSASSARTAFGLAIGTDVQAYDADLMTYAGITPSANVQTILGAADFAAVKVSLSIGNVENTALSTWAGTTNVTTLGTITNGVWNATAIGTTKGGVPTGGTTGQVLSKASGTSYDLAWADAAGGSAIALPQTAWLATSGAGGSDTTGTVGDPGKPYVTLQAAYDDGARVFFLTPGVTSASSGNLSASGTMTITLLGSAGTTVGNITDTSGNLTVRGNSASLVATGAITASSGNLTVSDLTLLAGATGTELQVTRCTANMVSVFGAANARVHDCWLTSCTITSAYGYVEGRGGRWTGSSVETDGVAGAPGSGSDGGDGGDAGLIDLQYVGEIATLTANGGNGGDGDNGGDYNGGAGGDSGPVILIGTNVTTSATTAAGVGGTGYGTGSNGAGGAVTESTLVWVTVPDSWSNLVPTHTPGAVWFFGNSFMGTSSGGDFSF